MNAKSWIIHVAISEKIGHSLYPCSACGELHTIVYEKSYAYRDSVFNKYKAKHPDEFDEDGVFKLETVPWAMAILEREGDTQ